MSKQHVCVMGLGYIGLPTAAILSKHKFKVTGVDLDCDKLETLAKGKVPIAEAGLDLLIREAMTDGRFVVSKEPPKADIYIVCVPTPLSYQSSTDVPSLPEPDMTHVAQAVETIASVAPDGALIILESTSPVGSTERISELFKKCGRAPELFSFAYCPERVLPGNIVKELEENDRIVGGLDERAAQRACDFYQTFVSGKVLPCKAELAELCKLVENSYRDVNIAFANEVSMVCDQLSLDSKALISLANRHPRVSILDPGIGVGGHCIAVDPWFIASHFPNDTPLIQIARRVNVEKTVSIVKRIKSVVFDWQIEHGREPKIAFLGLAYKANVADIRESPAVNIAVSITRDYPNSVCVEPHINEIDDLHLAMLDDVLISADIIVALVKHDAFSSVNAHRDPTKIFLDFCGLMTSLQ